MHFFHFKFFLSDICDFLLLLFSCLSFFFYFLSFCGLIILVWSRPRYHLSIMFQFHFKLSGFVWRIWRGVLHFAGTNDPETPYRVRPSKRNGTTEVRKGHTLMTSHQYIKINSSWAISGYIFQSKGPFKNTWHSKCGGDGVDKVSHDHFCFI